MAKKNKMDFFSYILSYISFCLVFGAYFKTTLFTPLISSVSNTSLSVKESLTVLLILSILSLLLSVVVTSKFNRNYFYLTISVSFPYGIYLIWEMYPYIPKWIIVYWCCCLICVIFCGVCIARRPIAEGANRQRIIIARWKRFGNSFYLIAGFFSIVMLLLFFVANLFGRSLGGLGRFSAYNFQRESTASIFDHATELDILHDEKWQSASQNEKVKCLESVIQIETAYLGLPHEVNLKTEKMNEGELGDYNQFFQEITIDTSHLSEDSALDCLDTTLHEMYHGYQHSLCEVYNEVSKEYRNLLNLRQASNYTYEFTKYESGEDFFRYVNQEVETDAREYAKERAEKYIEYLDLEQ